MQLSQLRGQKESEEKYRLNSNHQERENIQRMMEYSRQVQRQMENNRKKAEMEIAVQNLNNASRRKRHRFDVTPSVNEGVRLSDLRRQSRNFMRIQAHTSSPGIQEEKRQKLHQKVLDSHTNLANSVERMNRYDMKNTHHFNFQEEGEENFTKFRKSDDNSKQYHS
jgi:hypothetical protein